MADNNRVADNELVSEVLDVVRSILSQINARLDYLESNDEGWNPTGEDEECRKALDKVERLIAAMRQDSSTGGR